MICPILPLQALVSAASVAACIAINKTYFSWNVFISVYCCLLCCFGISILLILYLSLLLLISKSLPSQSPNIRSESINSSFAFRRNLYQLAIFSTSGINRTESPIIKQIWWVVMETNGFFHCCKIYYTIG